MGELVPYPTSVAITEVSIVKDRANQKVGISLKKSIREAGIAITGLTEHSLLHGTPIRSGGGQVLLAVNGDPNLHDVSSAATLMSTRRKLSLLVCEQHEHYNTTSSCIQIVAAPFFKHNPGICFTSTRGRTLVSISKIFKGGPFDGNKHIHKGDIVLAVNGIPVSKPEEADRALRYPPPLTGIADGSVVTILHVVNVQYFRSLLITSVDSKVIITKKESKNKKSSSSKDDGSEGYYMMAQRSGGATTPIPISYDSETQHMYDPSPYQKLVSQSDSNSLLWDFKNPKTFYKSWYQKVITFMDKFNERIDLALDPLEDLACEYAWRNSPLHHSITTNTTSSTTGSPTAATATTPSSLASPGGSVTAADGSSSSVGSPGSALRPTILVDDSDVFVPLPPPPPPPPQPASSTKSPKNHNSKAPYISC